MDATITGPNLVAETYQCSMEGCVEFGWCFKLPGSEDTEFDLVVGAYLPTTPPAEVEAKWEATRWAAQAIVNAAPAKEA